MSDLHTLAEYAWDVANSRHSGACTYGRTIAGHEAGRWEPCGDAQAAKSHGLHEWITRYGLRRNCPGFCGGCLTDRERKQWMQINAEIVAYFNEPDEQQGLPL